VASQGTFDPDYWLVKLVKRWAGQMVRRIPLSSLVAPKAAFKSLVEIKIFEKFDNSDFGLETIEFLLSN
jgi:hypothetical protein